MKQLLFLTSGLALLACALLFTHALVTAQGSVYELSQSMIGSGDTIRGGAYEMSVVVGDPAADEVSGGAYTMGSGFWGGKRVVASVTPTATMTATLTATSTATATQPGDPSPTATPTTPGNSVPTPTTTPTPPGNTNGAATLYLPVINR